jgi:uncharacterized protein (TIGR03067 family)
MDDKAQSDSPGSCPSRRSFLWWLLPVVLVPNVLVQVALSERRRRQQREEQERQQRAWRRREDLFKQELKALAGTWRPIFSETDGNKAPEERLKESSMTRDETGKVVGHSGDMIVLEGKVKKIDASKKPKTIDTEVIEGDQKGTTIQGIYENDGDTLRVCVVLPGKGERPMEFSGKAGSGCNLTVYKREKK